MPNKRIGTLKTERMKFYIKEFIKKRDLLTEQLYNKAAISQTIIKIDQDDLLPRAENEIAVFEWDAKARPKHCRANMSVAVAVAPGCIVVIGNTGGRKFFK